jgi:hypothetical protein
MKITENCEKIRKIWMKNKLNSEKVWKYRNNSEMIWKIWKKRGKRYKKYEVNSEKIVKI